MGRAQMSQDGSLFVIGETCYLKYYITVDGKRLHNTLRSASGAMDLTGRRDSQRLDEVQLLESRAPSSRPRL